MSVTYVIRTDLPPDGVTRLAAEIYAKWLAFALGDMALNGKKLMHPTGRYAASIRMEQQGEATIAVIADEAAAPEAAFLEFGHGQVDLKAIFSHGRAYPMHRGHGGSPGLTPRIWAELRQSSATGFASIGPNSPADSWIIPDMPAYSPALVLAAMARAEVRGR